MLLRLFQFVEHNPIGQAITASTWVYPSIQIVHLLGLTMLLGSMLVLNIRLMDVGMTDMPASVLMNATRVWGLAGLAVTVSSGALLFLADVMKYYNAGLFFWKMGFFALALVSTCGVQRLLPLDGRASSLQRRALASVSLFLWLATGATGRSIAFF